jgi:hypothetical protein
MLAKQGREGRGRRCESLTLPSGQMYLLGYSVCMANTSKKACYDCARV